MPREKEWVKLVRYWRARGRSALTPPFLCAACGMQPDEFCKELYMKGAYIGYCGMIRAPVVFLRPGRRSGYHLTARTFVNSAVPHLIKNEGFLWALSAHIHAQLAENKPSRNWVMARHWSFDSYKWTPFQPYEIASITRALGHPPPEITGVDKSGRIMYKRLRSCYS